MKRWLPLIVIPLLLLAACQPGAGTQTPQATQPPNQAGGSGATDLPEGADQDPLSDPGDPALEPVEVSFQADDGQMLSGLYYPAAVNPAPVVVLMHWVNGDRSDWFEIAPWLQNRGLENPFPNPAGNPWWDPTWFPQVPADRSYGVFIFTFRGCQPAPDGCPGWTPEVWLLDAQAAILAIVAQDGVDPTRIVAIGSSIGADGAADACAWLNQQMPGSCQGALSLSPGNFIDIPYPEVVSEGGTYDPPVAFWCLANEIEIGLCEMAEASGNPAYQSFMIPDGGHGNMLLRPNLDPLPMQIILDFLLETVGP